MTKDEAISMVCEVCNIGFERLQHKGRADIKLGMARHLLIHYLYHHTNVPLCNIGPLIGMSRPSVYKPLFVKPVEFRIKTDADFRELYTLCEMARKGRN